MTSSCERRSAKRGATARERRLEFDAYLERVRGSMKLGMTTDEYHGAAAGRMSDIARRYQRARRHLRRTIRNGTSWSRGARRRGAARPGAGHQSADLCGGLRSAIRLSVEDRPGAAARWSFGAKIFPGKRRSLPSRAFLAYRQAGGRKRSPLPDFYIGAHAEVRGYALLTRDPARVSHATFPTVEIIAPDTHP